MTNVFGERLWIEAADRGMDNAWGRWSMFTINIRNAPAGEPSADPTLLLLPTLRATQPGPLQEEVLLVRDEVANMAWGIENTVPLATGVGRRGREVGTQTFNYFQGLVPHGATAPPLAAPARYRLMSSVPSTGFPSSQRTNPTAIARFNCSAQPCRAFWLATPPPRRSGPQHHCYDKGWTSLLPQSYLIHEEEVPRAGARLTQYYTRSRWTHGQVYTWLRAQKQTGRGEASSGLGFDRLVDANGREV